MFNMFLQFTRIFSAMVILLGFVFVITSYMSERPIMLCLLSLFGIVAFKYTLRITRSDDV